MLMVLKYKALLSHTLNMIQDTEVKVRYTQLEINIQSIYTPNMLFKLTYCTMTSKKQINQ